MFTFLNCGATSVEIVHCTFQKAAFKMLAHTGLPQTLHSVKSVSNPKAHIQNLMFSKEMATECVFMLSLDLVLLPSFKSDYTWHLQRKKNFSIGVYFYTVIDGCKSHRLPHKKSALVTWMEKIFTKRTRNSKIIRGNLGFPRGTQVGTLKDLRLFNTYFQITNDCLKYDACF